MMNEIKVVYSIFVPPGRVRTLLDAIRLFAHPEIKQPAHITVRGPYPDYQDPRAWSAKVHRQQIVVKGVGTFFGDEQNTVFLHVESPAVKDIWYKPDYTGYKPHLTIYDGLSRPFAEKLRDVLPGRNFRFTFEAAGLEPMVLGNGSKPLRFFYEPSELAEFLDHPPTLSDLDTAEEDTRLAWITELAEQLISAKCEA